MKSFAFHPVDHLVLLVLNRDTPTKEAWEEYVQTVLETGRTVGGLGKVRLLAITDGGAPNAAQRKRVTELSGGTPPQASIITRSVIARGVVTAFSWLNFPIRTFAPERWREAFEHAGVLPDKIGVVKDEFLRLNGAVGAHLAGEVVQLIPD
jgi:hypothetical protein